MSNGQPFSGTVTTQAYSPSSCETFSAPIVSVILGGLLGACVDVNVSPLNPSTTQAVGYVATALTFLLPWAPAVSIGCHAVIGAIVAVNEQGNIQEIINNLNPLSTTPTAANTAIATCEIVGDIAVPLLAGTPLILIIQIPPGANLQNADFQGYNLAGFNLAGDNFQYANLAGTNLQGANFQGANLQNANLANANLQAANLQGDNLQNANLAGANLQGANLQGDNLQHANLAGAILTGLSSTQMTNFNAANMQQVTLTGALCGSPNYITAAGANTQKAVNVPAACVPPL